MDGSPGLLTTRPLIFNREQIHLFVNVVIQPGGFLQVAVLDVETQLPLADFPHNGSSIDGMPPNTAVEVSDETNSRTYDSTIAPVTWPATATSRRRRWQARPAAVQDEPGLALLVLARDLDVWRQQRLPREWRPGPRRAAGCARQVQTELKHGLLYTMRALAPSLFTAGRGPLPPRPPPRARRGPPLAASARAGRTPR